VVTVRGSFDVEQVRQRLGAVAGAQIVSAEPGRVVISVAGSGRGSVELLSTVLSAGLDVDGVSIQPPSLNSLFLDLTGRELRD
jgi:hypothetical protein